MMADNRTMAELLCAPTEGTRLLRSVLGLNLVYSCIRIKNSKPAQVNQQTSAMTTAMKAMLKQFQATPPPAPVKAVEEICVTCRATVNYNQGNPDYHSQGVANQIRPPGSGSLSSNTDANPKGELKAITTRSGLVTDGPTVPTPPKSSTLEVDERVEETFTDPDLAEYTIKVPPPPVQKYKPPSQREFVVHKRDPLHPNILYPSRMLKQKKQEKDKVQIQIFWQMFKQLHINITLAYALVLMPKYQKMLKALMSNKEKLQELANTPLNENCSVVILKKLPKKLRDPEKFLIPCGFSKLKCKALAGLGTTINLMRLSVWKELGLPEFILTRMTLELANRAICTPAGIARDVFVPVGKFTFPADFVIVDYESDPRVPLIFGRPFLQTARALIDVHGEERILRDGDERLTLNMRHDTSSYSNQPQRESVNLINIFNVSSEDFLEGELLSLATIVGFERGLTMHWTKDEFAVVLKKMANVLLGAPDRLAEASPFPTVSPTSKSLELSTNVSSAPYVITLEQNEEWVNVIVDGMDAEMTDGVVLSTTGSVFMQGISHVDDVAEVMTVGSERFPPVLLMLLWPFLLVRIMIVHFPLPLLMKRLLLTRSGLDLGFPFF
nr:reverse transcriptase domain-containing protein [Tanacetum cinerariifolium]